MCRSILPIPKNDWQPSWKMRRLPYRLRSSDCSIYFLEPPQQLFALTLIGRILLMIPPRIPSTSRNRITWLMCYLLPDPRVDRRELRSEERRVGKEES